MPKETPHPYAKVEDDSGLAAEAVPLQDPAAKRAFGDVKLPPAELVDELDNSNVKPVADDKDADEPVTLDFLGDDLPFRSFKLRHPFRWNGIRVEAVEVHALSVFEVAQAAQDLSGKTDDYYPYYARMTRIAGSELRLSAAVLRKMPNVDGRPIVDAAYDFLLPSSPAGDA